MEISYSFNFSKNEKKSLRKGKMALKFIFLKKGKSEMALKGNQYDKTNYKALLTDTEFSGESLFSYISFLNKNCMRNLIRKLKRCIKDR